MTEAERTTRQRKHPLARFFLVFGAVVCLAPVGAYLLAAIYIRIPAAARHASQLLTDYLRYPVTVTGLSLTGRTISIKGLTIGNPAGFARGELASSRSITITPDLLALLGGKKSFDEIAIVGGRVSAGRNKRGEWNFSELHRLLSAKKGKGETLIKRLSISQSSLAVEEFRLDNLALQVNDLATRGTTGSRFLVTCRDANGNPFRLEGGARLGGEPSLDLALSAPAFSLRTIAGTFGRKIGPALADGRGALFLTMKLREGKLAAGGKLGVEHLLLTVGNGRIPVKGELGFTGRYDLKKDELTLDHCSVRLNEVVRAQAAGKVRQLRKRRSFAAAVSVDPVDLKALFAMLPPELRRGLAPGGTLRASAFRFSGDAAHGITAGSGSVALRGGELARGGRLIVNKLAADLTLARVADGWHLGGRLARQGAGEGGMVQALEAPFTADLTSRLKPVRAELPSIVVTVFGLPAEGTIGYRPGTPAPLTFRLAVRQGAVARLNRFLAGKKVAFSSGTAGLSLQGSGRGPGEFTGEIKGEFADLGGSAAGKKFAVKSGIAGVTFSTSGGKVAARGAVRCRDGSIDGRRVNLASSFGIHGREFSLSDGAVTLDRSELRFARVSGPLPVAARAGGTSRLPLRLELSGVAARHGSAALDGLSGKLAVDYVSGQGRRRFEGSGAVAVRRLIYRGGEIGSLEGGLSFTGNGATADIHGKLLDGSLKGTVTADPFDLDRKAAFRINLDQLRCARLAAFAPAAFPVKAAAGLLDVRLAGGYDRHAGLRCRLEGDGRGIALTGKGGKTVLADGAVRTVCELAGGTLYLREGTVGAGKAVALTGKGELARPLSPDREGEFAFSVAATPLDSLRTAFVNLLPRALQEASAIGTMGAEGRTRLSRKRVLLDGTVSLNGGGLEIPSQKLSAGGITGTIPFSLDLTGAGGAGRPEKRRFSRDNYPSLLAALRQAAQAEETLKIATIRFGGVEFGETSLTLKAGNGLLEITSLESALFHGALLGDGFFRYGRKIEYGADLVVDNLSLRALCDAHPKIRGYISGRVDGVMSLYGEGQGVGGLRGFTEIWTHSAPGERMLVSKEFLQKLAGRKLKGIFFRTDRPYDRGEIRGYLEKGYLTFDVLDISHTNLFGVKDLSVTVAPVQNKIALGHLFSAIREAATRGKAATGEAPAPAPIETEFKWEE